MSQLFDPGYILQSIKGAPIEIQRPYAQGGQGAVYCVHYGGEKKLLRWFFLQDNPPQLRALWSATHQKMISGAPGKSFFWPEDMTDVSEEGFGYITRMEPENTVSFRDVLSGTYTFPSWRECSAVACNLAMAFWQLHEAGYCFHDFSDSFLFSTQNGSVLFPDTEDIQPIGTSKNVLCPARYLAPEVLLNNAGPGVESDRFTLAVCLFQLFCLAHPLEGRRLLVPLMTPELEKDIYARAPLFLFDRENPENRPHPVFSRRTEPMWKELPGYVQELFFRAFTGESLQNPSVRPDEAEWFRTLCRMKNDRILCSCGKELFAQEQKVCTCPQCGQSVPVSGWLILPEYAMPLRKGLDLHRCMLGPCERSRMAKKLAQTEQIQSRALVLKNISGTDWDARTPSGTQKTVKHEETVPILDGIVLYIDGVELRIEKK